MKDRPLAIFEVHAVMDDLSFQIKEFSPPLILKAMEAICVDAEPVSNRRLGVEIYDWHPLPGRKAAVDIYLSTSSKIIKCHRQGPPSRLGFAMKRKLRMVADERKLFNDVLYNDSARYAISYIEDGQQQTALIDTAGFINWSYAPNGLRQEHMRSVETVRDAIAACSVARMISPFVVDELNTREPQKRRSAAYSVPPSA
jgi:hypothetical protein